jgi:hypothetical protein
MEKSSNLKNWICEESGQMLLIVFVFLLLLFVIVFAVVSNVLVDIKEVQITREYEKAYSIAESELIKISKDTSTTWVDQNEAQLIHPDTTVNGLNLSNFCPSEDFSCYWACGFGDDKKACVILKSKGGNTGTGTIPIDKDDVLEIPLDTMNSNSIIDLSWTGAPAIAATLICRSQVGSVWNYYQYRATICSSDPHSGCGMDDVFGEGSFSTISEAKESGRPLRLSSCGNGTALLLRLRAIGSSALVDFKGSVPETAIEEIHVQGFPAGFLLAEDIPAPELYYLTTGDSKAMPAIFDYVLFVANGDVLKSE